MCEGGTKRGTDRWVPPRPSPYFQGGAEHLSRPAPYLARGSAFGEEEGLSLRIASNSRSNWSSFFSTSASRSLSFLGADGGVFAVGAANGAFFGSSTFSNRS